MSPDPRAEEGAGGESASLAPRDSRDGETPDLGRAVTDMRRLLDQLEAAARTGDNENAQQPLAVMARMLQYVHDSHARIVATLENQDRSEMFLQSTQALNQTFRRLNQSQDALVDKLLAERRRNPWYLVLGASIVAVVVVVSIFLLIDHRNGGLRDEVDRMASTRDGLTAVVADSQRSFHEMGSKLAETVDKTLAANRVLDNENRAKAKELETMRADLASAIARRDDLEREKTTRDERLSDLERERGLLESKIEELRTRLLDRELAATKFDELLEERLGRLESGQSRTKDAQESIVGENAAKGDAQDAGGTEKLESDPAVGAPESAEPTTPDRDSVPEPKPVESNGVEPETASDPKPSDDAKSKNAPAPAGDSKEQEATRDAEIAEQARFDLTTQAVNQFLVEAGVLDHRLLRHSGVKNGELAEVTLELRDSSGAPVGFKSAAGMKLVVDPGSMTAKLLLRDGEAVVRGERTPFADGAHSVAIAAVAPRSFTANELMPFLVLEAPAPDPATPPPPSRRRFDPREPIALLNSALSASGRGHVRFSRLGDIDVGRLVDVELNHYSGAGALQKTVIARSCGIEIDEVGRRVSLVFTDGKHRTKDRETPFFAGRGRDATAATWRLDLDDADVETWIALKERLRSERFEE